MVLPINKQSLTDFRDSAAATIERLNQTGEAEIITVDGEARAVVLSASAFAQLAKELEIAADVAAIQHGMTQLNDGHAVTPEQMHSRLRGELLAMKAATSTTA